MEVQRYYLSIFAYAKLVEDYIVAIFGFLKTSIETNQNGCSKTILTVNIILDETLRQNDNKYSQVAQLLDMI